MEYGFGVIAEIVLSINARSAELVASSTAAKLYKLKMIKKSIEDYKINQTRSSQRPSKPFFT